jgi:hypothetical protein
MSGAGPEVHEMRIMSSAFAGLLLAVAIAAPTSANTAERFSFDDVIEDVYSCGVILTTQVHGDVIAHHATDGTWLGSSIRLRYDGLAVDPATGDAVELAGRQIVAESPDTVALRGQGIFIRLGGGGVILLDVGRLVIDPADDSTLFASAHVIAFDDPDAVARIDAAVCSLFD